MYIIVITYYNFIVSITYVVLSVEIHCNIIYLTIALSRL